jgi:Uma2 family endonuclease
MVLERRKFTLDQYHQMDFLNHALTEFIDGEVYSPLPTDQEYDIRLSHIHHLLTSKLGNSFTVNIRKPLVIGNDELRPDIGVFLNSVAQYISENITLIVEVGCNSLGHFQKLKIQKYASVGIQELWIVDLNDDFIWVYRQPSANGYLSIKAHQRGETLTLLAFPDITITVNEILGEKF